MISEESFTRYTFFGDSCVAAKVSTRHKINFAPKFLILSFLKLLSCEIVVFIDMNTNILTEGRKLKHS